MERCVQKHLSQLYLNDHSIITPFQSGFQAGDSTVNQLLYLCNEISNALDNNKELCIIFLDISKAFDRVWHKGLLFKLKSIGASRNILAWFEDYLSDRYQRVCIKKSASSWKRLAPVCPKALSWVPCFLLYL